jgi:LPXTG-site transpeptidase (sortase) family protein
MEKKMRKKSNEFVSFWLPILSMVILVLGALFWNNISWIANGDVWHQYLSDVFPQFFPRPYVMAVKKAVLVKTTSVPEIKTATNSLTPSTTFKPRRDMITIPKIGITAPIITANTDDNTVIHGLLDSGVVLYPGSAPFGAVGQTVLLGHSAPAGWPKIKYDWVFSKVGELKKGDMVVVTYNNETRYYQIVSSRVVMPKEGVPAATVPGNSLMILSCWPPGKDLDRIAVEATIYNN